MQGPLEYECLELATMLNDGYDRVIHLLGAEPIGLEIARNVNALRLSAELPIRVESSTKARYPRGNFEKYALV